MSIGCGKVESRDLENIFHLLARHVSEDKV